MSTVAVIGVGTMGGPMAQQILAGGHQVRVFDPVETAMATLVEAGAVGSESATAAGDGADVAMLSLPGPPEVVDAVGRLLQAEAPPSVIVDLSTNAVDTVRELRATCDAAGVAFLDAPVSGGVRAAETGSLTVMVGGEAEELEMVREVLDRVAGTVFHVGPSGAGAVAKLVNNQIFLTAGLVLQEAYVSAQALGMEPADVHRIIAASSAGPYAKLAPLMLGRTFDDVIFRLDIAAKDLELAASSAAAAGVPVPLTEAAIEHYRSALEAGLGERAFHATLLDLEARAGVELARLERPPRTS